MDIIVQLTLNSIIAGAIYTMVALGFNLIYGTVRFFDLGYGALTAVGGYGTFFLAKQLGVGMPVSILFGMLVAGLISVIIYRLVYVPLRARKAGSMVMIVASLGVFTALQAVIAILFTSQFQTLTSGSSTQHLFTLFGGVITQTQVIILLTGLVLMTLLSVLLKRTMFGKSVVAIGDSEEVAQIVGVRTQRVIGWVFFIGGSIAGLAGILVGFDTGIEPTMGLTLLLKGVIAAIIGGIGNVYGGVLGAFLLGFVENFGIWHISGEWKDAIAFGLLIIFLVFRPGGILRK